MSNIYIQEPPTIGKVLLQTTVGDIDIELWSKEAPKACRNFVQLCLEGYYDGTIFHRLVKGFIVQGGDPNGTGEGGASIYGKPFRDEFHTRLRFVRRGLVAMANAGKDDNGSQFFFTLAPSQELQSKHTIFGKVTGITLFNMMKLGDSLVDANEKPLYPHKIITTKILSNPFPDIIPRVLKKEEKSTKDEKKPLAKGTKNFKLLSFGEEAEEEEAEVDAVAKEFRGKSKSSHDLTNDPKLSSVPAIELAEDESCLSRKAQTEEEQQETLDRIKKRLRRDSPPPAKHKEKLKKVDHTEPEMEDDEKETDQQTKKNDEREKIREEIRKLKKEIKGGSHKAENSKAENEDGHTIPKNEDNNMLVEFYSQSQKYKEIKEKQLKKGSEREQQTLALLAKFRSKMESVKEKMSSEGQEKVRNQSDGEETGDDDNDLDNESWLAHTLRFDDNGPVVAKDANIQVVDRYEISDPRNPINERKRDTSKHTSSKGKKH